MSAFGKEVHFCGAFCPFHGEIPGEGTFHPDLIVFCLDEEHGGSIFVDFEFRIQVQIRIAQVCGIDQGGKIRSAAQVIDRIHLFVRHRIGGRGNGGGQVRSGGEAHDPDSVRIHIQFCGVGTDEPDGAAGVCMSRRPVVRHPVFQQERAEPDAVEVGTQIDPFMIPREDPVSAAGADDHGGVGTSAADGVVRDAGAGHIGETRDPVIAVQKMFGPLCFLAIGEGHIAVPEGNLLITFKAHCCYSLIPKKFRIFLLTAFRKVLRKGFRSSVESFSSPSHI